MPPKKVVIREQFLRTHFKTSIAFPRNVEPLVSRRLLPQIDESKEHFLLSHRHLESLFPVRLLSVSGSCKSITSCVLSSFQAPFQPTKMKAKCNAPSHDLFRFQRGKPCSEKKPYTAVDPEGYFPANRSLCAPWTNRSESFSSLQHTENEVPHATVKGSEVELPSAREIHDVIVKADREGDWERVIRLFTGALQLQCIPFTQTYELVVWSVMKNGGFKAVAFLMNHICTTPPSVSSFLELVERIWILRNSKGESEKAFFAASSSQHQVPEVSASQLSDCSYSSLLCFPKEKNQDEDLSSLMEEALQRRVLLPHRLRLGLWHILYQNRHPRKITHLYQKVWEIWGPSNTEKRNALPRTREVGGRGVSSELFPSSRPSLFSSFLLQSQEMRLLLQAAGMIGDARVAILIGHHYILSSTTMAPLEPLSKNPSREKATHVASVYDLEKKNDDPWSISRCSSPLLIPPPDPVAIAAFGTAFFKYHADHPKEAFSKYVGLWMQGIHWLSHFPSCDTAVTLKEKMKTVAEMAGKAYLTSGKTTKFLDFATSFQPSSSPASTENVFHFVGKEHVLELLAWSQQLVSSALIEKEHKNMSLPKPTASEECLSLLALAPELRQKAKTFHCYVAPTCEVKVDEIRDTFSHLYIMEEHEKGVGHLSLPSCVLAITLSLAIPTLAVVIWEKFPSSWWNARLKGKRSNDEDFFVFAFLVDLFLRCASPDALLSSAPTPIHMINSFDQESFIHRLSGEYIQLASALMSKLLLTSKGSCRKFDIDHCYMSEEEMSLINEKKRDILLWVSELLITLKRRAPSNAKRYEGKAMELCKGSSFVHTSTRYFSGELITPIFRLLCLASSTATDKFKRRKTPKVYVDQIMERFALALQGLDAFFRTPDGCFQYSPQQVLAALCQYGVEHLERVRGGEAENKNEKGTKFSASSWTTKLPLSRVTLDFSEEALLIYWGIVLAYYLQCERRFEVAPFMTETIENSLRSLRVVFLAESYACMMKEWNGDVGPYRRLVWPLLLDIEEYGAALEVWLEHLKSTAGIPPVLSLTPMEYGGFLGEIEAHDGSKLAEYEAFYDSRLRQELEDVYKCKVKVSEEWIQDFLLKENKPQLADLMLELVSIYASLRLSSVSSSAVSILRSDSIEEHDRITIDFLTRPSTERAVMFLFEGSIENRPYKIVRRMIEVFQPLLEQVFSSSPTAAFNDEYLREWQLKLNKREGVSTSIFPSLMFYVKIEKKIARNPAEIKEVLLMLEDALRPFEEKVSHHALQLSLSDPSAPQVLPAAGGTEGLVLDLRKFMFAVHCLANYEYYSQSYWLLQRLFSIKRRWGEAAKLSPYTVNKKRETGNVRQKKLLVKVASATDDFEEYLLLPNEEDRRQLQFASTVTCLLHTMIPMFDSIASDLLCTPQESNNSNGLPIGKYSSEKKERRFLRKHVIPMMPPAKIKCHELCLSVLFFVPLIHHPADVQRLTAMLCRWRRKGFTTYKEKYSPPLSLSTDEGTEEWRCGALPPDRCSAEYRKLLSAGAGRIGFRLLNESYDRGLPVPLSLVELSCAQRFLTKGQWLQLLRILQSCVVSATTIEGLFCSRNASCLHLSQPKSFTNNNSSGSSGSRRNLISCVSFDYNSSFNEVVDKESFPCKYSFAVWRVLHSLHTLKVSSAAVAALRSLHPFHFPLLLLSATPSMPGLARTSLQSSPTPHLPCSDSTSSLLGSRGLSQSFFSVEDILSMVNSVSVSIRKEVQEYVRHLTSPITLSSSIPALDGSLRKHILRFVELGAAREAFLLLVNGLELREACLRPVLSNRSVCFNAHQESRFRQSVGKDRDVMHGEEEFHVDAHLLSMVLRCVADNYSWRTTLRCWTRVHELLPYFWWKVSSVKDRGNSNWTAVDQLMDAYRSLMNIMLMPCTRFLFPSLLPPQQHLPPSSLVASASELLEVIEIGIVQFGLPLMSAHGPGSQVLVELLASEKKLTISERVHCREWLNRMRDYFHEQKVVDHMQKICNGIKNENRCTVGENSFSRESSPFFFGVGASLLPSPAKPVISGIKGGSVECNEKDKQILAVLSPLILFSSTYQLEVVSKKYFDGRLRSYELKPLVLLQQTALKQYVKEWNSSSVKEECEVGIPDEIKSLRKDVVDQLADKHLVLVHISQLFHEFHNLRVPNEEGSSGKPHVHQVQQTALVSHGFVEAIIKKMVQHTFHSLLPFSTASELWTRVQNRVTRLAQHRWSRAVEAELCQEVWERGGVPPHSLSTAPKVTRRQIEHYWSVYHFILLPELQFDTAELCCMAYYVPELIALHRRFEKNPSGYQEALWELASTIHTSHFTSCSLFEESRGGPIRRPRSLRAIHALLHRGRKTLVRLHHQLEMDARGTRYLFHLYGGPRHHQDYITPSNGLNLLRNFYDLSAFSLTSDIGRSVSRITALHEVRPSRVEPDDTYSAYNASNRNSVASRVELIMMVLACGNISPLDTHEEEMKMPFFARYISEAAVRDQQEAQNVSLRLYALETFLPIKGASPGTGNSGVSPVLSRTSFTNDPKWNDDKLLQVVHECCERIRGHNGPSTSSLSSLPSWLLFWHGRKAKELVQEESTMPKDAIVRELLRSIKDPVVSGLGMLHVHFAWYGKEIPVELSEALMEHVKFIIYHSVPNRERDAAISYNNPFCSLTSFFTPQEDQYYAQKPLLDLVVLWKMFSFFNVWKSIHFSRRNVFWYLLSPSLSDIDSLPCKTKSKRGKEKKSRDPE